MATTVSAWRVASVGVMLLNLAVVATAADTGIAVMHTQNHTPTADVLIVGGKVIDGSGSPWVRADVAITGDRIVAIGQLRHWHAKQIIDAHERVVTPGFIDMLGQSELSILVDPRLPSKIYQGITSEITGEGNSVAPLTPGNAPLLAGSLTHYHLQADWRDFNEYFQTLTRRGMGINLGSFVGATSVRAAVVGFADRRATPEEIQAMQALVATAMRQGALGLSSSLQYAPAPYASTAELTALAQTAAQYGGIYATHLRSEGAQLMTALDEAFSIGNDAHLPVEIWHLKAAGVHQFGWMPRVVDKINSARAQGIDVTADTYGYTAWFNSMSAFMPPWAHDGGPTELIKRLKDPVTRARIRADLLDEQATWDNEWQEVKNPAGILIGVTHNPQLHDLQGKTLAEIAASRHQDPLDTLIDILAEDQAETECAVFGMQESDVALGVIQPWMSFNNDSAGTSPDGLLGQDHPHPRAYGTFPRILRVYVREQHLLPLETMIQKFTALPASRLGLTDRGLLKLGMKADVVIFDPATLTDNATFAEPNQLSNGMQWVLVNGQPVIANGQMTGRLPGQVIKGPGVKTVSMHP